MNIKESDIELDISSKELKKNIGKVVIQMNNDMMVLQKVYKKVRSSEEKKLSTKDADIESRVIKSRDKLKETITALENQPSQVAAEGLEKFLKLMKTTMETAEILIDSKEGYKSLSEDEMLKTKETAQSTLTEVMRKEQKVVKEFDDLSKTLSTLVVEEDAIIVLDAELDL